MPKFSKRSQARLDTCHSDLRRLFQEVVKSYDCTIICGRRGKHAQDAAFAAGLSKLRYPLSKHNHYPSLAVDAVPYPIDWNDKDRFIHFGGFVQGIADQMGIRCRWGGDWNSNRNLADQHFMDYPHFELIKEASCEPPQSSPLPPPSF